MATRLTVRARSLALASIALFGVLSLSGCAGWDPFPKAASSSSPTASSEPTATATDTPATASAKPSPLMLECSQLLSLQDAYDLNPNLAEDPAFSLPSALQVIVDQGGVACGWVNLTSGEKLAVAVAKPGDDILADAANRAASQLQAVPTYGTGAIEGFFGVDSGLGIAETFGNGYWVMVASDGFVEPGDAARAMSLVRGNLS